MMKELRHKKDGSESERSKSKTSSESSRSKSSESKDRKSNPGNKVIDGNKDKTNKNDKP